MMMRFGFLVSALVGGLTVLPSICYGFDGAAGRQVVAPCAATRTASCGVAPILPGEAIALPAGAVVPVPLPRPPNLGRPGRDLADRFCVHRESCR